MAIQAYVFVSTTNPGPRAACLAIRAIDGVVRADALLGGPPVIALVEGDSLGSLEVVIDAIVDLPMVTDTETHVVRDLSGGLDV